LVPIKNKDEHKSKTAPASQYGGIVPNADFPGDSIDEHRRLENANIDLTGDEIRQQNENL
jgi:hypothetical protein